MNKSWRQHPTRHQLYGHLTPIMKTIQVRWTRHTGHCWRSRDELISDVLLWTPAYGQSKAGRPAWIYIQQLCEYTGCSPEDLPEAMNDREKWWERVRDIRACGTTWWWWFHYRNSLEVVFTKEKNYKLFSERNSAEIVFAIEMHYKLFYYRNTLQIVLIRALYVMCNYMARIY